MHFLNLRSSFVESSESNKPAMIAISILLIISTLIYLITFPDLMKKMKFSKFHKRALHVIFYLYFTKAILFSILTMMNYSSYIVILNIRAYFSLIFIVFDAIFFIAFLHLNSNVKKGNNCFEYKPKRVFELIITVCVSLLVPLGIFLGNLRAKEYPD